MSERDDAVGQAFGNLAMLAALWIFVGTFAWKTWSLPVMTKGFPLFVIILLGPILALSTVRGLRELHSLGDIGLVPDGYLPDQMRQAAKPVSALIALGVYVYSIPRLGFFASLFVFILALSWILGLRGPTRVALTALSAVVISYLLFVQLLSIRVPHGVLP